MTASTLLLPEPVRTLLPALGGFRVWLVGGCVRDLILGRPTLDFDFAVERDGARLGRRLANELGADYFDLDPGRGAGRILLTIGAGRRATFDFATMRGPDILEDLGLRDFTVNAMALPLSQEGFAGEVLDPLHGGRDLREKLLRACSPKAIADDPVRGLRAVRFAVDLGLRMDPETLRQVRSAHTILDRVSPERLRDELFRILDGRRPGQGLRLMDELGLLESLVPELGRLRGLVQPEPHAFDGLTHTLATVDRLGDLVGLLCDAEEGAVARDLVEAETLTALGRFRVSLCEYLEFSPSFGRRRRALLAWAALLHDTGKPETEAIVDGRLRFLGHELVGSRLAIEASRRLRLSTVEQAEVEMTVLHHMRPAWLEADGGPTARGIYRFFRAAESTGVSVVLLSMADLLGRDVPPVPEAAWRTRLATAQALLASWFEPSQPGVAPVPFLTGDEVMQTNEIPPGPEVGRILDALREAQAIGEVQSREDALAFVERLGRAGG